MPNSGSKAWERRRAEGRITAILERRRVLIVCEDEKSSRFYFEAFPHDKRLNLISPRRSSRMV